MGAEFSKDRGNIRDERDTGDRSTPSRSSNFLGSLSSIDSLFSSTMSIGDRNARELAEKYKKHQLLEKSVQIAESTRKNAKQYLASCTKSIPEIAKETAYKDFMTNFSKHGQYYHLAKISIERKEMNLEKLSQRLQELNRKNKELSDKFQEFQKAMSHAKARVDLQNTLKEITTYYQSCGERVLLIRRTPDFEQFDRWCKQVCQSLGEAKQWKDRPEDNAETTSQSGILPLLSRLREVVFAQSLTPLEEETQKLAQENEELSRAFGRVQKRVFDETLAHFHQLQQKSATDTVEFHTSPTFEASRQFPAWQKRWENFFQNCSTVIQDLNSQGNHARETQKPLRKQLNQAGAIGNSEPYLSRIEQTDTILASMPKTEDIEKFKENLDQLKIQFKLQKVIFAAKYTNKCLSKYKYYSDENYSQLKNLGFINLRVLKRSSQRIITEAAGNNDHFGSFLTSASNDLTNIQKDIEQMSHIDIERLDDSLREAREQLGAMETLLNEKSVTIDNFRELSDKITEEEKKIPKALTEPTMETFFEEIREKSAERESQGMNKPAVELILKKLYKHTPPIEVLEDGQRKFRMFSWPQTSDGSRSLQDKPPYKSYVNPQEGSLSMYYVYRTKDQNFKDWNPLLRMQDIKALQEELQVKSLPDGFSEALNASDFGGHHYQSATNAYRERRGSDVLYQPLKVVKFNNIENDDTTDVLGQYVKTDGETKTFSEEEEETFEAFNKILRTPLGRITPFMLAQNPEKLGYEETKDISHIDVKRASWDNFVMTVYIAD